ncbi:ATP-binding protein, partial [bacterium]|nr:ATP-binding protein [bacterium]
MYKAIASYGSANTKVQYDQLHTLVWGKMMPESRTRNEITTTDILYTFGFSDLQDLFPVTSKFESTSTLIEREQLKSIVDSIKKSTNRILCLHGGAGIGKSTIINQFQLVASGEMEFVMFDCYGAGSYLDPDDNRHKPEKAYLQLCNDLALKIGSPFLLNYNLTSDRYLTEFTKRLKQAAEAISKSKKIICIVIDAADNSVSAALKNHQETFVHQLVDIHVPEHCRIVLTCRTERKHSLKLPDHVVTVPLNPFSTRETGELLKNYYPSVTKKEITE